MKTVMITIKIGTHTLGDNCDDNDHDDKCIYGVAHFCLPTGKTMLRLLINLT